VTKPKAGEEKAGPQLPGMEDDELTLLRRELTEWYHRHQGEVVPPTIAKSIEYGGADLRIMGAAMRELANGVRWEPTEQEALEMALGFYLLGKVARMFGAWAKGRSPGSDTPFDTEIYSQMFQKVRETGRWT
jgi:hypothetical protein